nr:putative S-adenosyl-L-methionine-dependent methyltransferase [Ipomoea batatas]
MEVACTCLGSARLWQTNMESVVDFRFGACTATLPPLSSLSCASRKRKTFIFTARANSYAEQSDPVFRAAVERAAIRFQESQHPLFIDPYAGCFFLSETEVYREEHLHPYCLATKYIDDKLLSTLEKVDGPKQVVLLTDGMDTRPFRLNWPASTIIYDVSPEEVFRRGAEKLQEVGAKIPRACVFHHVPLNSSNLQQMMGSKGFNGARPSIWAFQVNASRIHYKGLPLMNLASFKDILCLVSNLAMKGCFFLGELPIWLAETDARCKSTTNRWLESLFMSCGFRVEIIGYNDIARNLDNELVTEEYTNILFVAEHLRFSDDQMELWRREFQRIEEEGDEDGFEEL